MSIHVFKGQEREDILSPGARFPGICELSVKEQQMRLTTESFLKTNILRSVKTQYFTCFLVQEVSGELDGDSLSANSVNTPLLILISSLVKDW